jgi:UDP-N-acetylmuramyl pentapeptide phosphotransferase/UDP-N-acetylglucosamine-1-phosphate transferase
MGSLALTSLVALGAALMLTAAVRTIARRWGVVDRPDGRRKLHGRPTPLWGGVAVYGATVLGLVAARFGSCGVSTEFAELSTAWMIAAGFVCFVGSVDDRFDLPSRVKLALQIISVLPIVLFGYYVDRVVAFSHPIELGWLGIPLTVLWLVGCINALNLIDGMDGLASIVGLSATAMLGVIAASRGHDHVAVMATVLAASLLGFLMYNLPPAGVFLGDSGSMVIGLSVGLLGIQGSLKTSATLAITAPAVVMTLPMFDIIAALVRRKLTGRRFDSPDRLHIHHRLLDRGWTPWQVLCLIGAVCLTTGAAATAATIFRLDALAWITAISLVVLMIRLRLFGYEEFAMVKGAVVRTLKAGMRVLSRLIRRIGVRGSPTRVQAIVEHGYRPLNSEPRTPTPALWDLLLDSVRVWDIQQVEFSASQDHQFRRIRWIDPTIPAGENCCWSLSVSLPDPTGASCELRASGTKPITDEAEFAALTSLLKTFGAHFAAQSDLIFGPALVVEEPAAAAALAEHQRRAA